MTKFELGQRVKAPGRLLKEHRRNGWSGWYTPSWARSPVEGIYVGTRTYACGIVDWYEDSGAHFLPKEYIKVGLIINNPRRNPVPVLYEELEVDG